MLSLDNRWRIQGIAPPGAGHDASTLAGAATTPGRVGTNAGNHVPSDASSTMVLAAAARRNGPLVPLDRAQWTRLYKEVTARDRAQDVDGLSSLELALERRSDSRSARSADPKLTDGPFMSRSPGEEKR